MGYTVTDTAPIALLIRGNSFIFSLNAPILILYWKPLNLFRIYWIEIFSSCGLG